MLRNLRVVQALAWVLIGGGGVLFVGCALLLAALHPATPANELVNGQTVWLFIPSALMVTLGMYISLRYWRCPNCGLTLSTRFRLPRDCPRCGHDLGLRN